MTKYTLFTFCTAQRLSELEKLFIIKHFEKIQIRGCFLKRFIILKNEHKTYFFKLTIVKRHGSHCGCAAMFCRNIIGNKLIKFQNERSTNTIKPS